MPRVVAFDTETFLFGPGNMAPRVVCLSWADGEQSGLVVGDDNIEQWLHHHLNQVPLVGHVVAYDAACIMATFPSVWDKLWAAYADDNITCTAVRERLLDIAAGEFRGRWAHGKWEKHTYHLADIAARRLKKEVKKGEDTWRLRYGELDGVPLEQWPQDAVDYAVGDAVTTWEIFQNQEERSRHAHYSIPTQFEDTRADLALRLTSVWGIETDPVQVDKLWIQTIDRMDALVGPLAEAGFAQYKKTTKPGPVRCGKHVPEVKKSLKALRAAITEHYPGGDPPKTAKGAIMTGKDVVRECHFEPLQQLVEFEQLRKVANTYLTKLFDSIVHAQFHTVGAASDRTSSSGPNLQNQPRLPGIRECFIARSGRVLLACDFDAQEMRTLAQSCLDIVGYSRLAERFQNNSHFDPHLEFAASLAGITIEKAKELKAAKDAHIKDLRQQSKCCNFGYPGGMGSSKFVDYAKGYGLTITEARSQELRDHWFEQWPEMRGYFKHVESLVGSADVGWQTIPQSGFVRGNCGYCDAANGYFQTLAAHASKAALFAACRRAYCDRSSMLYGSRPVVFIHDEIILETPEEAGHEAAKELEQVMVESMQKWTPDVPSAASATLMRRWSKSADQVYDGERLVAWEPEEE